jgi:prepilin-type N-terminal cleavage/methylation domain-containing protein/prepilin-type processing-associated H-X9-DG protein
MKNKKGFTLVELLVVISIIALLLSVLMPALNRVREQAKKVVCQANVKQQVVACMLYQGDYNTYFPTWFWPASYNMTQNWQHAQFAHFAWGGRTQSYWVPNPGGVSGGQTDLKIPKLLNTYVGAAGSTTVDTNLKKQKSLSAVEAVFHCPADVGIKESPKNQYARWDSQGMSNWDYMGYSYMYNGQGQDTYDLGLWNKKVGQVKQPETVVLVADMGPMYAYFGDQNPYKLAYWHHKAELGWANTAFVDGHANYMQFTNKICYACGNDWTFHINNTMTNILRLRGPRR